MKKIQLFLTIFLSAFLFTTMVGCGKSDPKSDGEDSTATEDSVETDEFGWKKSESEDTESAADGTSVAAVSEAQVYGSASVAKKDLLIVISKKDLCLNVYSAPKGGDTTLLAQYPVCLSRNKGDKERTGDMRTPESSLEKPFHIKQIQNASDWEHDFNDGRGSILAYGDWFMRLDCPGFNGIGIHGSTNNAHTVPGRDSEGCIRLRDSDLIHFHDHFVYVGEPVVIKHEGQGPLPFETRVKKGKGTALPKQQKPADDPNAVSSKFDHLKVKS